MFPYTDHFIKLNKRLQEENRLKILRLYGRTHERKDYPDPIKEALNLNFDEVDEKKCQKKFRNDALHHKIREVNQEILALEEKIRALVSQKTIPSLETRMK